MTKRVPTKCEQQQAGKRKHTRDKYQEQIEDNELRIEQLEQEIKQLKGGQSSCTRVESH